MNLDRLRGILAEEKTRDERAIALIEAARDMTPKELEDMFEVLIRSARLDSREAEALIEDMDRLGTVINPMTSSDLSQLAHEVKEMERERERWSLEQERIAGLQIAVREMEMRRDESRKHRDSINQAIARVQSEIDRIDSLRKEFEK
jgi:hypothetical protein